jgi:hypothetical protein
MAGFLAFFIWQILAQIVLPLILLQASRGVQPPLPETRSVYYSVRPPTSISDVETHRRLLDGPQYSLASGINSQSGRVTGFPTEEAAQEFCANFKRMVANEGWILDRCDVF